jgi:branched-chain amino acid transport system substrate-binding protein
MAEHPTITRRRLLSLFGAAATLPVLAACGSSVGGGAS